MRILSRVFAFLKRAKPVPLDQWFFVSFDDVTVHVKAQPPGRDAWEQSFPWSAIERVCFKDEGIYASDGLYIFTNLRPESFVIPTEGNGGEAFFAALHAKGFFPTEIFSAAISSTDGGTYCWPRTDAV